MSDTVPRLPPGGPAPAPAWAGAEPPVEGSTLRDYWAAVRRRRGVVLVGALIGGGLAAAQVFLTDPTYTSATVVEVTDPGSGGGSGGLAGLAASLVGGGGSLTSQVEVFHSRLILGQVVDSLGLRLQRRVPDPFRTKYRPTGMVEDVHVPDSLDYDELRLAFGERGVRVTSARASAEAAYGAPLEIDGVRFRVPARPGTLEETTLYVVPRRVAVDGLVESVKPMVRTGTDLVDVFVVGYDPAITERIANETARRFQVYTTTEAHRAAVRRREWVVDQMRTTEAQLHAAQDALTAFRQREQIYSSKTKLLAGQASGGEVELERAKLGAERRVYMDLLAKLQRSGNAGDAVRAIAASPAMAANPVFSALSDRYSEYQLQRDSLTTGPGSKSLRNPDIQRLDSLIGSVQQRMVIATRNTIESVDARIDALDQLVNQSDAKIQQLARSEPEEMRLLMQVEAYGEALKQLREKYYSVGAAEAMGDDRVTVLDEALPGQPAGAGPKRTLLLGLIFGLMVGGGAAVVVDAANRSIRRREEMEQLLRVPGLAVIPALRRPARLPSVPALRRSSAPDARLLVSRTPTYSVGAEAYRTLRTNLLCSPEGETLRSVVISSPAGGEGKTTTASNLAVTMAQQGMRVLLVDCDFRRARLHALFRTPRAPGLAQMLEGTLTLPSAARETEIAGLHLLTAGALPQVSPSDLLSTPAMRELVDEALAAYDLVVFDAPPLLPLSDAALVGRLTDGVILVVRAGHTDRDDARLAVQQLRGMGVRLVGGVLNDPGEVLEYSRRYYEPVEGVPA